MQFSASHVICALVLGLCAGAVPGHARSEQCSLGLVLALDVSGSVNELEYTQQLDGLSHALNSQQVRASVLNRAAAPVQLAVFEWSSRNHQFLVQPWTVLDSHTAIDRAVTRIRTYRKQRAGLKTALSTAMLFAAELLEDKNHCWQRTIDVSSDGKNNIGPALSSVYDLDLFNGVTVNALVVGDPVSSQPKTASVDLEKDELRVYYEREVIRGTGAFAMIAHGYRDYVNAMQRKLLRELAVPVLGSNEH